jgi:serine/tyrosine/threonine adenylyltransferase
MTVRFSPDFTPNTSDNSGRYRWSNQPAVGQWNILALASVFTQFASPDDLNHIVNDFAKAYEGYYRQEMCKKLGIRIDRLDGPELQGAFDKLVRGSLCGCRC